MSDWSAFLDAQGAVRRQDTVIHFGDPAAERQQAMNGSVCCELSPLSILAVRGEDAGNFLQAQLTADLNSLSGRDASLAGWCDPGGRVLFVMLIAAADDGMRIILPTAQADRLQRRLHMYILRSRVSIEDLSADTVLLGLSGPEVPALAQPSGFALPGTQTRRILALDRQTALAAWQELGARYRPAGWPCWELLDILDGHPALDDSNSGQYLPQMLNLDALGGLSYRKGCYPGQEIVARLHYRGEVKRRLQLALCPLETPPAAGAALITGRGDKAGTLLRAAPLGDHHYALQPMLERAFRDEPLHLGAADGPPLEIRALPYPCPE